MCGGLAASYGTLAAMAVRFVYPARPDSKAWLFVTEIARLTTDVALAFQTPSGQKLVISKTGEGSEATDFIALSSVCPHLGCQVHWESQNNRFFCPCHNGAFDPSGKAIAGPPADAGQSLLRYPLKVENGLLFIQVPVEKVSGALRGRCDGCPKRGPA